MQYCAVTKFFIRWYSTERKALHYASYPTTVDSLAFQYQTLPDPTGVTNRLMSSQNRSPSLVCRTREHSTRTGNKSSPVVQNTTMPAVHNRIQQNTIKQFAAHPVTASWLGTLLDNGNYWAFVTKISPNKKLNRPITMTSTFVLIKFRSQLAKCHTGFRLENVDTLRIESPSDALNWKTPGEYVKWNVHFDTIKKECSLFLLSLYTYVPFWNHSDFYRLKSILPTR